MHELQAWEDAVLAALAPLQETVGLRTLAPYQAVMDLEDLAAMTRRFPAVYVFADGLDIQPRNRVDAMRVSLVILVGDRHVRGTAAATRRDAGGPGVYGLLAAVRDALHGRRILTGWSPLTATGEAVVEASRQAVLFGARYAARTPRYREE